MKHRFATGAAACALLVLAAAWTQQPEPARVNAKGEPPSYRDVLNSYVGKRCGVSEGEGGMHYLHFPEDKRMNWQSGTLMAVGADFVQVRGSDGASYYFSLTRLDLEVAPPK